MNDSTEHLNSNDETGTVDLIAELPSACATCGKPLCLRQQVINLALGFTEQLKCLNCLALQEDLPREQLLTTSRDYVMRRECFKKEWIKYKTRDFCPDKVGCLPESCFR